MGRPLGRTMKINGLPVVDATKSIVLRVKPNDIRTGKSKDQAQCPAAVACMRQLKATEVRVHLGRTYVRYNGQWKRYITSSALRDEIVAVDRNGDFQPGEYTLIRMQPSRAYERKYRQNLAKNRVKKYRNKKVPKRHIVSNVRPVGIYA